MKVLISGGCGYIGSTLIEYLLPNFDVIVYDNLMYRQGVMPYCHHANFDFVWGDVRDTPKLRKYVEKADILIPLAALVGAGACDRDPELATQVNCEQIKFITAKKSKEQLLLFPNTNSGYGATDGTSYCTEESPLLPLSHYGRTKCRAEEAILEGDGISFRLATIFGTSPRMRLDLLVNDFVYKALSDRYIVLFEKNFKRNVLHVRDVALAFTHVIDMIVSGKWDNWRSQIFNLGNINVTKLELAQKIAEYTPLSIQEDEIHKDPDKRNYIVSSQKIESLLGWFPQYSLEDGIKELIKAYPMYKNYQHRNA